MNRQMLTLTFISVVCAGTVTIAVPAFGAELDLSQAEKKVFAGRGPELPENQNLVGFWDEPEDYMHTLYSSPATRSTLVDRVDEAGGMSDYNAFYFSNDPLLSRYIDAAIYANPALWESEHRWRAALERIPQVSALPDPMFNITQFIDDIETRVGPQKTILSISQKLPWFGKLDAKAEMALRDALSAVEEYQARIREIVASVKRSYYDLAYLDAAIRVTEQDKSLLEHFADVAEKRYETGSGIQQAVIKIQAEITRDSDRLLMLRQQRESMVARLNTLMNNPPQQPIPVLVELVVPAVEFNLDRLYTLGKTNQQDLLAAKYQIEKSDQQIRLAKKEYFPDFTVGFNYWVIDKREDLDGMSPPEGNGDNADAVTVGFNIPLWEGKLMSGVREARELRHASERAYDRLENQMQFSVRDGVIRAETAADQLSLYEKVLIPQAEQALDSTQSAYSTGTLNALDLIDSERFLLNVRIAHAKLAADYMTALADIERAIGTAFPVLEISERGIDDEHGTAEEPETK
jgi:cobalt-zinc-cadmium efflux system outer membrane protein